MNIHFQKVSPNVRTSLVIALLLLTFVWIPFGLVGIVVMWLWTFWPRWVKVIVTIPFGLFFVLLFLSTTVVLAYLFLLRPFQMRGNSMAPNYREGMYLMTRVVRPTNITVNRGEVIIFKSPSDPGVDWIQRVVGLPGESIMIKSGNVYVNNQKVDESTYLPIETKTEAGQFMKEGQAISIPPGQYVTLGDNRQHASDSRVWGFLPQENIISKVSFCYWYCGK